MGFAQAEAGRRVDTSPDWTLAKDLTLIYVTETDSTGYQSVMQHVYEPSWRDPLRMISHRFSPFLQSDLDIKKVDVEKQHVQELSKDVELFFIQDERSINNVQVYLRNNRVERISLLWSPTRERLVFRDPPYRYREDYFLKDGQPDIGRSSLVRQGIWSRYNDGFRTHIGLKSHFEELAARLPRAAARSVRASSEMLLARPALS